MPISEEYKQIITHLIYIKEKVDSNEEQLRNINGRVRNSEQQISFIKGIGAFLGVVFATILGIFIKGE